MSFAFPEAELITWLASYPKSGNTWVRCLLDAYRSNGHVDINDIKTGYADSAAAYTRSVSAIPLANLQLRGEWLLRPAALLMAMSMHHSPRIFKTHYANVVPDGMAAFIPREMTQRAVYIVRDPRSLVAALSGWFTITHEKAVEILGNDDFCLLDKRKDVMQQYVASWSRHVNSWANEKRYPVLMVRYEDLVKDTEMELGGIVHFLGMGYDVGRIKCAVKAAELSKLRAAESSSGFREFQEQEQQKAFFGKGGTRWKDEVEPELIAKVEEDHRETMVRFGYLEGN